MLLVINIENNTVNFGLFKKDSLIHKFKIKTDILETVDEVLLKIKNLLSPYTTNEIDECIISSVVPDITKKYLKIFPQAVVIGAGIKTGLNIRCENPKEVGADRIIKSAYSIGEKALTLSIDEVITIDFVNGNSFMGGMIIPGMSMALNSLKEMAKLSKVEFIKTDNLIGNSTTRAIQTGIYNHYLSTIKYVIQEMKQNHEKLKIVATGEQAKILVEDLDYEIEFIEDLDLYGLQKIYFLNKKSELI